MKRTHPQAALVLKALGEPRRMAILELLRRGPCAVGKIAEEIDVSQQAASQHLAILDEAGLVEAHREGTRHLYAIRPEGFSPALDFVRSFWEQHLGDLKREVEKK